ncbi:MAG: hypothetical protein Hens3KO_27590 [Henriciella sp.]
MLACTVSYAAVQSVMESTALSPVHAPQARNLLRDAGPQGLSASQKTSPQEKFNPTLLSQILYSFHLLAMQGILERLEGEEVRRSRC